MLKWRGFLISDHIAALKRQAREEAAGVPVLPKMAEGEIRATLNRAYTSKETVQVQSTDIDPNLNLYPVVEGKVMGSNGHDSLVLDTGVAIPIGRIRSVQVIPYAVQ
ncbi:phage infection protein [Lacticaseibacillus absianus]|uniref:phage infection protein n=1 Tax=Lacticaseibacillus absianus TaxID=2729623 RepID=UPI0015C86C36|nr:phage infection protein [Lacticaseibacillus absianus]